MKAHLFAYFDRRDVERAARVPRHVHHEPDRAHHRGDRSAGQERRGRRGLALRRHHARVPPRTQLQALARRFHLHFMTQYCISLIVVKL